MESTHDAAYGLGRLAVRLFIGIAVYIHGIKDPSLDRL